MKYTKEQLIGAVQSSTNLRQVLLKLNISDRGRAYPTLKRNAKKLGVDISHLAKERKTKLISDDTLRLAVQDSKSMAAVLRIVNLDYNGGNISWLKNKISKLSLDISHFTGAAHALGKSLPSFYKYELSSLLVKDSAYVYNTRFKDRLIKENILEERCAVCSATHWNNAPLALQLDHINGVNNDNRVENLRLLCPNCHSQTPTFAGRNINKNLNDLGPTLVEPLKIARQPSTKTISAKPIKPPKPKQSSNCLECQVPLKDSKSGYCMKCKNRHTPTQHHDKIAWPSKEDLEKLIWEKSAVQLSKELGVSDKAIEKRCKKLEIQKPPRGYWAKLSTATTS